jgi:glycosyltransferase involved in cell wall biosynthesis
MATIFFASDWLKRVLLPPEGTTWHDTPQTGYGNLRSMVRKWADLRGHTLTTAPEDADMEILVGDPGTKPDPHMWPSAALTMFEQSRTPAKWSQALSGWTYVLLPSTWCVSCFKEQFHELGYSEAADRVRHIPLGFVPENFPYVERPSRDTWTIIAQGVELRDRKGLEHFHGIFSTPGTYPLPNDLRIVIKILPVAGDGVVVDPYLFELGRLTINARVLPSDEFQTLLGNCDYSVNPTAGEGFGLIPVEHMSTGMGVSVTHWSGVMDYVRDDLFRPIDFSLGQGQLPGAMVAVPHIDSVYENIMWSYENQDEARRRGRVGSDYVRDNWTVERMYTALDDLVTDMLPIDREMNTRRRPVRHRSDDGLTIHEDGRVERV